jgi:hypothetical protein
MTIAIKLKELMAKMPDTLNTKKEIDEYYKDAMKKSVENNKLDANAVKPKKELNGYQQFMKNNIKSVKEENPSLTGPEVFSKIAELWKKQKEDMVETTKNVPDVAAVPAVGDVGAVAAVPAVADVAAVPEVVVEKADDVKTEAKMDAKKKKGK